LVGIRAGIPLGSPAAPADVTLEGQEFPLPRGVIPTGAFAVSPGYFRTLGISVAQGREFTDRDTENAPPVAMINQWAARRWWPGTDPVGRTIKLDTASGLSVTLTVVGVARDNRAAQPSLLLAEDGPELYRPYEQAPSAFPTFFVRATGAPAPLQKPVREILVRLVPDRPLFTSLASDLVDAQLSTVRLNAVQIVAFALIGLCLALLGVHGVLSYAVGRRTQEIGIRGALGATRAGLQRMVLADGMWLTTAGLLLGLPVAAAATRLIRGMLYGTNPTDPLVYAAVGLVVAVVSLGAGYLPARRAARVDPLIALRAG
jgi:predicted permease